MYKLVTEEDWQLVFPLDEETEAFLLDEIEANKTVSKDGTVVQNTTYIEIRFVWMTKLCGPPSQYSMWTARLTGALFCELYDPLCRGALSGF